jgi:hypothetical protein
MTHPRDFRDTDPKAMEVWLQLQRDLPAGEKISAALNGAQMVLSAYEMGVRRLYPDADEREVSMRVAARHLPVELMIRAYGWDPALLANGCDGQSG